MQEAVGFIGLGIMGKPMVKRLIAAGHRVSVHVRDDARRVEAADLGVRVLDTPAAVARASDVTFTMVSDTPDVVAVVLGPEGVLEGLVPGRVLVDMSTISAVETRRIAQRVEAAGAAMLDAPVSGGEVGAINGTLSIMVGGTAEAFARCQPLLRVFGHNIVHVGESSSGQIVKSCNQILAASTIVAMGEALVMGAKAGVDPARIVEVLSKGAARCWALEVRAPHVLEGDFQPGFKCRLQYKDLGLALELARSVGAPAPFAASVHELYKSAVAQGFGEEDHTSVIRVLEGLAAQAVRSGAAQA